MGKKVKQKYSHKIKIKKGDQVIIIAGSDKGKQGEVLKIYPEKNRATVAEINMRKKHQKPTQDNPNGGGISEIAMPIHISNMMLVDPKSGTPTRIGKQKQDNGKSVRISKKSGEIIS